MIDFTTIQTFPTPAVLAEQMESLTNKNIALSKSNAVLRKVLAFTAIVGVIIVTYVLNKKHNDDERK